MLERLFALAANGTTVRREILAGCTTFLTMSAILFVNPDILAQAGIDPVGACVGIRGVPVVEAMVALGNRVTPISRIQQATDGGTES